MSTTPVITPYQYGFSDPEEYLARTPKGLNEDVIRAISAFKQEPAWMLEKRLAAYQIFLEKPMPTWGADLSGIDFDAMTYFMRAQDRPARSWDDVSDTVRNTFDRLGVPEAERKFLAGVGAQYESEVVYHSLQEVWKEQGVIFLDTDTALREHEDIMKQYFGTLIPAHDNKFAALNTAVWSGGSFVYIPKGVKMDIPLQAYFRINARNAGQFERTLIIVEEGAYVHYVEGCLPGGEQVSTEAGWVNIERIKPGDRVYDHQGNLQKVSAVMTHEHHGEMVTVRPVSRYNSFRLTPEHPVLTIKRADVLVKRAPRNGWLGEVNSAKLLTTEPRWIPAGELEKGDFVLVPKLEHTGASVLSDDEVELLGYFLAEGSTTYNKANRQHTIAFSLGLHETAFAERIRTLISTVMKRPAYLVKQPDRNRLAVVCYSQTYSEWFIHHCGKGACTKQLSPEIMDLPLHQIKLFLDSYQAGDGNVSVRGNSRMIRFCTGSETVARQVQTLLNKLSLHAVIQVRPGGKSRFSNQSDRFINRQPLYHVIYTDEKKWDMVRETDTHFLVPIREVSREPYDDFVFNIDVDKSHSYLARGVAVHNCSAPTYSSDSLHAAVVEVIVKPEARARYTTIQNWSDNVYNLVTKRATAHKHATMEWVDCNLGSQVTMKYPSVFLVGEGARAEILSLAMAGHNQHQDAGGKAIHLAPNTSSLITSKSVSHSGGRTSYRGIVKANAKALGATSKVVCDALILDADSRSDTYPTVDINNGQVQIEHEATVSKIGEEQLFYLRSRGLTEAEASSLVVNGFIEPIVKELPMEFAVEMNRLIELQMEGSVG